MSDAYKKWFYEMKSKPLEGLQEEQQKIWKQIKIAEKNSSGRTRQALEIRLAELSKKDKVLEGEVAFLGHERILKSAPEVPGRVDQSGSAI